MAHIGQVYKLWFRRDAAWDLNNYKFAFPEAYFIISHGLITSPRYAVSQIKQVMAINKSKEYDRTWTSPTYGGFFDNVYWTLEFPDEPNDYIFLFKFSIYHDAVIDFPLFSATYQSSNVPSEYHFLRFGGLRQLHFLSPEISVDPERFNLIIAAARWDRYNPTV